MEVLSTGFNAHPPLVVVHLFQMHGSASGDNLIKCRSPILQPPLESDLDGTAVVLPNQVVLFRFTHPWMIARLKLELSAFVQAAPTWRGNRSRQLSRQ